MKCTIFLFQHLLCLSFLLFISVTSNKNEDSISFSHLDEEIPEEFDFYSFFAVDIDDNIVSFERYRGQVTLVVNVASECGYTDNHYKSLNLLNQLFRETGKFNILAFPCNQFGGQEPGTLREIHNFAYNSMGATFLLFSKINVIGQDVPPSWNYLIQQSGQPPTWNFWKYLVDHQGKVIGAWGPTVSPDQIYQYIDNAINKIGKEDAEKEEAKQQETKTTKDEF
ncbi:glutathione peroxidase 7 [Aplysia californica]|uniref:Glutathione peroxidase n=1 Tax=Aplysia californica TaxID=6500 RepID=A0ABM0JDW8_APLCA|nr:glutathione peroxidase 7 [Aplysia californica]